MVTIEEPTKLARPSGEGTRGLLQDKKGVTVNERTQTTDPMICAGSAQREILLPKPVHARS